MNKEEGKGKWDEERGKSEEGREEIGERTEKRKRLRIKNARIAKMRKVEAEKREKAAETVRLQEEIKKVGISFRLQIHTSL